MSLDNSSLNDPETEAKINKLSSSKNYGLYGMVGSLAGLIMETVLFPIDVARTRMKANASESVLLLPQMKKMYRSEGLSSFYRGYTCLLAGAFCSYATYFYVYESLKDKLTNKWGILSQHLSPFVAAFTGSLLFHSLILPFNVVKTRMQLEPGQYNYKNFFDGAKQIIKHEGISKLYLGYIYIFQGALDLGFTFGFYELFSSQLRPFFSTNNEFSFTLSVISSVSASIASACIINPLDVVVTRLQAHNTESHGSISAIKMARKIYVNEGLGGFMKGLSGTVLLFGTAALVLFPAYEYLKATVDKYQDERF